MSTLEPEDVGCGIARGRILPAGAAFGKFEGRARVGTRPGRVPLVGDRDLFREIQSDGPAAKSGSAAVGYAHVHLEKGAACIRRRRRTGVRGKCLIAQHEAGQEHADLD